MPEKPSKQSYTSYQFAEILIKILKPGGIGIGSLYGLYLLLIQHKVAESIAAAFVGFCFSYCVKLLEPFGKLLEPIQKGNSRRFEELGEVIDTSIDENIEQLWAKATRAEDAYLVTQALDCRDYRPEGMSPKDRIFIPMLKEVFVPLEIGSSPVSPVLGYRLCLRQDRSQEQYIWNFLAHFKQEPAYRKLAIVAWGGFGKTTLLKYLSYIYGTKQHHQFKVPFLIPVLLPLRRYRQQLIRATKPSLSRLIMEHHVKQLAALNPLLEKLPSNWMQEKLTKGKVLVMMDGFDEIPEQDRQVICKWINVQIQRYDNSIFILSSRPTAYKENYEEPPFTKLWVSPFNHKQQEKFVKQWYFTQEKLARGGRDTPEVKKEAIQNADDLLNQIRDAKRPELADLAQNPLLLNLLASYHRSDNTVELPRQRAQLYQDICTLQLRKRPAVRDINMPLRPEERQTVLQAVALMMMQSNISLIPEEGLIQLIGQILNKYNYQIEAKTFIETVIEVSELMVLQGMGGWQFSHFSFQEYLAAAQIRTLKQESILYPYLKDAEMDGTSHLSWWRQTILLYAAQVNPVLLIQESLRQGATNLAYACLQESQYNQTPSIESDLKSLILTIQSSRFSNLENLLATKQWQEADRETYRLMITTVGRELGQWFSIENLMVFPCEELQTLDHLWFKHSHNKWGFSIQMRIWDECGSPMNYGRDWENFGDRIGWRKDGNWIDNYNEITFKLDSSSEGNFPWILCGWCYGCGVLLSRAKACEL